MNTKSLQRLLFLVVYFGAVYTLYCTDPTFVRIYSLILFVGTVVMVHLLLLIQEEVTYGFLQAFGRNLKSQLKSAILVIVLVGLLYKVQSEFYSMFLDLEVEVFFLYVVAYCNAMAIFISRFLHKIVSQDGLESSETKTLKEVLGNFGNFLAAAKKVERTWLDVVAFCMGTTSFVSNFPLLRYGFFLFSVVHDNFLYFLLFYGVCLCLIFFALDPSLKKKMDAHYGVSTIKLLGYNSPFRVGLSECGTLYLIFGAIAGIRGRGVQPFLY